MELREIFQILKRRCWIIFLVMAILLSATVYFTTKTKDRYETSAIITVQANRENNDQYQYGGYYSIQASELYINTILGWVNSSNFLSDVYTRSGISFDSKNIKKLGKRIYTQKIPPQNITISVIDSDKDNSRKLTENTIALIKEKNNQLTIVGNSATSFEIVSSDLITISTKPNMPFNILIAFIISLVSGLIIISFVEYMSPTLNSIRNIKNIFSDTLVSFKGIKLKGLVNPEGKAAEKFRFLRANTDSGKNIEVFMAIVASASDQGSSSLVAANIALSFARSGKKTLLVDANFISPMIHEYFDRRNEFGFSEFLFDEKNIDKYLQKTNEANLNIISSGIKLSYASDTIERANIERIIHELEKEADIILINVPALNTSSEAFPLFNHIKNIMLVIRMNKVRISNAKYINEFLEKNNVTKSIIVL